MTMKLNSLARWTKLAPDTGVVFAGKERAERRVRLNLNLEAVTTLMIGIGKEEQFLCTAGPGLETIEFCVAGTFKVYAEKGSGIVMYQSADLEPTHTEVIDPVIFTRIAQRRHRNPELEEIMYRMQSNMDRRLAQQADENAALLALRMKELENAAKTNPAPAPISAGGSEVPAQVAPVGEPAPAPIEPAAPSGTAPTGDPAA